MLAMLSRIFEQKKKKLTIWLRSAFTNKMEA